MKVELVRVTENAIDAMASAGSNCYDSEATKHIVSHCYSSGHHSVLEFAEFHFHIEGISRACSHQLVRHRIASFAQRSQRYVNENQFEYVVPPSIIESHEDGAEDGFVIYHKLMQQIQEVYDYLVRCGIPAEDARFVLPNACETIIDFKINLRALINFFNHRLCERSQWEIRQLAKLMKKEVLKVYPELKDYLVPKCMSHKPFNFCTEAKCCGLSPKLKDVYIEGLKVAYEIKEE